MVFNATFNSISVISWRSVLLVAETGGPGENPRPATDKLYHIMLYTSPWSWFELKTSMVIGTDCIGSCKSNYHTITATTTTVVKYKLHTAKWLVYYYHSFVLMSGRKLTIGVKFDINMTKWRRGSIFCCFLDLMTFGVY